MALPKVSARPKTVPEYIAAAAKEARSKLREMRRCVRAAAPGAVESIKWGMPSYSYKRILVIFAAFKHHISFFPGPRAVLRFKKDLPKYKTSRATIQFPLDQALPLPLIRKITAFQVKESVANDGIWTVRRKATRTQNTK
jgi:uncharacterized protein YdhG (YjbR/CyaY superfamily)